MHHSPKNHSEERPIYDDDEIDLVELLLILWKYRIMIVAVFIAAIILAGMHSISKPRLYSTKTTIINMIDNKILKNSRGFDFDTIVRSPRNDILYSILNSNTLREQVVKGANLLPQLFPNRWDKEKKEWITNGEMKQPSVKKGARRLKKYVKINMDKSKPTITISATSHDPELSAIIANSYTKELEIYLKNNTFTSVKKSRQFLEKQLHEAKNELETLKASKDLFQKENGIFDLKQQIATSLDAYNTNALLLSSYETDREMLEAISSPYNPRVLNLSKRIDTIKNKMDGLTKGTGVFNENPDGEKTDIQTDSSGTNSFIPLARIPFLKMQMAKLDHEIKLQQKIYDLIVESYEKITIQESKDKIFIKVLDRAEIPERPLGNKTRIKLILGACCGLFIGVFLAFIVEFYKTLRPRLISNLKQNNTKDIVAFTREPHIQNL